MSAPSRNAVFLDRDGVLIEDRGLITSPRELQLLPGVPEALTRLARAGFALVVVSNQPVIARGLATETQVRALHQSLEDRLVAAGAPRLDGWYFCPHHPRADLPFYQTICDCRKPRPGLLLRAAADLTLDLHRSFMVGDRITDVAAGRRAGCRTLLVQTGKHNAPPITLVEPLEPDLEPDHLSADLPSAASWILAQQP